MNDISDALHNEANLVVIVVTIPLSTSISGRSNSVTRTLIRQVTPNLLNALLEAGEKNRLLILTEPLHVPFRALGQQEAPTTRNFEALMHKFVLIGASNEAEIDLRA